MWQLAELRRQLGDLVVEHVQRLELGERRDRRGQLCRDRPGVHHGSDERADGTDTRRKGKGRGTEAREGDYARRKDGHEKEGERERDCAPSMRALSYSAFLTAALLCACPALRTGQLVERQVEHHHLIRRHCTPASPRPAPRPLH